MRSRLALLCSVAVPLAVADLAVKAAVAANPALDHARSHGWELGSLALLALAVLAARLPSRLFAAAAGVFAAGIAGNLVSALRRGGVVPNVLVTHDLAFNLADVLVLGGIVLLAAAGMRLAVRHRHLLPTSTIPVRIARRARARYRA